MRRTPSASLLLSLSAARGGYLWRYSENLRQLDVEGKATESQVWVQPPGTPALGLAFVRAYQATGERQSLNSRGRRTADGWSECRTFIRNLDVLVSHLDARWRAAP